MSAACTHCSSVSLEVGLESIDRTITDHRNAVHLLAYTTNAMASFMELRRLKFFHTGLAAALGNFHIPLDDESALRAASKVLYELHVKLDAVVDNVYELAKEELGLKSSNASEPQTEKADPQ